MTNFQRNLQAEAAVIIDNVSECCNQNSNLDIDIPIVFKRYTVIFVSPIGVREQVESSAILYLFWCGDLGTTVNQNPRGEGHAISEERTNKERKYRQDIQNISRGDRR